MSLGFKKLKQEFCGGNPVFSADQWVFRFNFLYLVRKEFKVLFLYQHWISLWTTIETKHTVKAKQCPVDGCSLEFYYWTLWGNHYVIHPYIEDDKNAPSAIIGLFSVTNCLNVFSSDKRRTLYTLICLV